MVHLTKGRYRARIACDSTDIAQAQALRNLCFRNRCDHGRHDADAHDVACQHMLVEEVQSGALTCCFRLMLLEDGRAVAQSYSAQFYDLGRLADYPQPMIELGRFCIHPDWQDPDILRLAWGALARAVDVAGAGMLFGCTSFAGAEPEAHAEALMLLARAHQGPERWRPGVRAASVYPYTLALAGRKPDLRQAMRTMPPLLRTYLSMGGWVSDHAVVDAELNTMHVFTGLEVAAIPGARARLLRDLAKSE